ncbi:MAG: tetratricopeptide repeat protein [Pirellulales bacterium]|nr:tetratricopeptide repeat protein [Pirellulales bacterium]
MDQGTKAHDLGDFDVAIDLCTKAIDISPLIDAVAHYTRGLSYTGKGEYNLAIKDLDVAIVHGDGLSSIAQRERSKAVELKKRQGVNR